jgi:hypothetical protein
MHSQSCRTVIIELSDCFQERRIEVGALLKEISKWKGAGRRTFQQLPRHLRRRAMSHNVHKIPVRVRQRAIEEARPAPYHARSLCVLYARFTPSVGVLLRVFFFFLDEITKTSREEEEAHD